MSCQNCTGAITQQQANDEKIINIAKEKAREQNQLIGLYRDEQGRLCIATQPTDPIIRYISPQL